ncbi:MAG: ABC transporter ATP-binding protein [Flavobacteriales bacterium]|nr:MAG: ABC transporter ATP-binding protein [Flavobacteriales bacterium]
MFDLDRWQEIYSSIRSNVLRTVLSGFTVALGLYIFIVLFGIGKGLQNAFSQSFNGDASNLIRIFTGRTTEMYNGMQSDRKIILQNKDFTNINKNYKDKIEYSTGRTGMDVMIKYGRESGNYQVMGANPDEQFIEDRKLIDGRYLSPLDFQNHQKVAVIGRMVQRDLIKNGTAVGKYIEMNGIMFRIIGVFSDAGGDRDERMISVPLNVLQQLKKNSDTLNSITIVYDNQLSPVQAIELGDEIKDQLKKEKSVSPDDENGIRVWNDASNKKEQFQFVFVLTLIVGVVGLGTLMAGIIGISNIMVYIVKERTKEIGVRKAIGAKPKSIVGLILQESIVITVVSGFVGIGLGVLTLKLIDDNLEKYFIINPSVGWELIIVAFFCLVFSGTLAGFVPAYKASKIKPVEALTTE